MAQPEKQEQMEQQEQSYVFQLSDRFVFLNFAWLGDGLQNRNQRARAFEPEVIGGCRIHVVGHRADPVLVFEQSSFRRMLKRKALQKFRDEFRVVALDEKFFGCHAGAFTNAVHSNTDMPSSGSYSTVVV